MRVQDLINVLGALQQLIACFLGVNVFARKDTSIIKRINANCVTLCVRPVSTKTRNHASNAIELVKSINYLLLRLQHFSSQSMNKLGHVCTLAQVLISGVNLLVAVVANSFVGSATTLSLDNAVTIKMIRFAYYLIHGHPRSTKQTIHEYMLIFLDKWPSQLIGRITSSREST